MRKILLWIWLGLLIGGCSSTPRLKPVCPIIVTYSDADQKTLLNELKKTGDNSELIRWIGDYIGLRDQIRLCQTSQ